MLAGLLIGLGLVYQTRYSSEFAISHNSHSQVNCVTLRLSVSSFVQYADSGGPVQPVLAICPRKCYITLVFGHSKGDGTKHWCMRKIHMGWAVLIILAILVVAGVAVKLYVKRGPDISKAQLQEWIEQKSDVCILDVRTVREYSSGHIPGAINIGHRDISTRLDELRPCADKDVVVYCALGVRARMAQTTLAKAGFLHVYHLTGNMAAWRRAGLATETTCTQTEQWSGS